MGYADGLTLRLYNDCIHTLARENTTIRDRETLAFLIGKRVGGRIIGRNAHVFSAVNGGRNIVEPSNDAAERRFMDYDAIQREQAQRGGKRPCGIFGTSHSHLYDNNGDYPNLSSQDIESIEYYMDKMELADWTELLVKVKRIPYAREYEKGSIVRSYPRRLGIVTRNGNREGIHMTYIAYYLWREGGRLRKREIPIQLAESFI
jgi:hypothetical protein